MVGKRFTEEQVAYALRQAESGTPVADLCGQLGVSEASSYLWKKKFSRHGMTEIRELRQLRNEDGRTTEAASGRSHLHKHILGEMVRK